MNPQMAPHHQAQYQPQLPPHHQNIGQQRQAPNGQQHAQGSGQQKGPQGQQQLQNPYHNYDPQLTLFTLEKPKNAKSWEDVEPEQQHIALQDLQNELNKFRRNRGSVRRALNEISSRNCRRIINELVENQTKELWNFNRTLQYRIASVEIEWRSVNRRERQLKRVQVMLETEPSGLQEPLPIPMKLGAGAGNPYMTQDPNKAMKQSTMPQSQQLPGQPISHAQNMGPPPRNNPPPPPPQIHNHGNAPPPPPPQSHNHGHAPPPPPPQIHNHGNAPPPPPPPGGGHIPGQPGMVAPLPPPQPGSGQVPHGPPHGMQHPQGQNVPPPPRGMPSTFPEPMPMPMPMPMPGMRQAPPPPFEAMDPGLLRGQKSKHKGRYESPSSGSDDWSYTSGSSGSEPIVIERGDYGVVGRRERGRSRHSTKSKKSRQHKSHSKVRSRSRSRSRSHGRRIVDPYIEKTSRRRRDSDTMDGPPPMVQYNPTSSKPKSPRSSRTEFPPIHVTVNTNNSADDRAHKHERARDRRGSLNSSPTSFYKDKRKLERINTSQPMSRESSSSRDRASGTASFTTSSAHTTEDAVFDAPMPMRRPSLSRGHSRTTQAYPRAQEPFHHHPHPSHIYDDIDRHPKTRYPLPNDYPHHAQMRDSYFEEPAYAPRPSMPHRRNSAQIPSGNNNPFAASHYPPKPMRAMSYAADVHEPGYVFPPRQQRYIADHAEQEDRMDLAEIADALEHIKQSRRVPLRRESERRSGLAVHSGDEWEDRFRPSARYAGYRY